MRQFINVVDDTDTLLEAQNYSQMFTGFLNYLKSIPDIDHNSSVSPERQAELEIRTISNTIQQEISWAKQTLVKNDRVVWWLRWNKFNLMYNWLGEDDPYFQKEWNKIKGKIKKWNGSTGKPYDFNREQLRSTVGHLLSLNYQPIRDYVFAWGDPSYDVSQLQKLETEWIKQQKEDDRKVQIESDDTKLMTFDDGTAWWMLSRHACDAEAKAMGHCGNAPSSNTNERILSLRSPKSDGRWMPHLTFILDENQVLGEMKGRGNEKPNEKYHPHIIGLLTYKSLPRAEDGYLIKGIKGGGYYPEGNFSMDDLEPSQAERIKEININLKSLSDQLSDNGETPELISKILNILHSVTEDRFTKVFSSVVAQGKNGRGLERWRLEQWADLHELIVARGDDHTTDMHSIILDGDFESHSSEWFNVGNDDVENFIENAPDNITRRLEQYLMKNYPGDAGNNNNSIYDILYMNDDNDAIDIMQSASDAVYWGMAAGAESNMYDGLIDVTVSHTEPLGITGWLEYDSKKGLDSPVSLYTDTKNLILAIETDGLFETIEYEGSWVGADSIAMSQGVNDYTEFDEDAAYERFADLLYDNNVDDILR